MSKSATLRSLLRSTWKRETSAPVSMSPSAIHAQKPIAREMVVQQTVPGQIWAQRYSPRIAFKAKGKIIFMDLAEILAVQAEGNYVSLKRQPNSYLLRESLSSIAETLKPYGFVRIHRSVVVNTLAVEEIHPLATGEYSLRVRGGKEYTVTRKYKESLKHLAQLWLGSECTTHYCRAKDEQV